MRTCSFLNADLTWLGSCASRSSSSAAASLLLSLGTCNKSLIQSIKEGCDSLVLMDSNTGQGASCDSSRSRQSQFTLLMSHSVGTQPYSSSLHSRLQNNVVCSQTELTVMHTKTDAGLQGGHRFHKGPVLSDGAIITTRARTYDGATDPF